MHYRKDPYFYYKYDLSWLAFFVGCCVLMIVSGWQGLATEFGWWMLAILPVTMYLHVLANVCVHNACHGNFPRAVNRLVGEILGALVLTRYASWEILHVRHHKYSDDPERDPHHVIEGFWRFFGAIMTVNIERQLRAVHFEQFGETPMSVRRETVRSVLSFFVMLVFGATWFLLLGPWLFFLVLLPSQFVGWVVVAHFNWATHNAGSPTQDYRPVNLDHGFYWIGNRIWCGLYMHGDHHKYPNIFNPLHTKRVLAARRAKVQQLLGNASGPATDSASVPAP